MAERKSRDIPELGKGDVDDALLDAAAWREVLEDALRQTGGPITEEEREWADAILGPSVSESKGNAAG